MAEKNESNLYGALAYLLTIVTGIIMLLIKPNDKYVKFHAMQSIIFGIVLWLAMAILTATIIGLIIVPLVGLLGLALWIVLMWKAYNGEKWKLPVIGEQAEKMAQ